MTKDQLDALAVWIRAEALAAVAKEKGSEYTFAFEDRAVAARQKVDDLLLENDPKFF